MWIINLIKHFSYYYCFLGGDVQCTYFGLIFCAYFCPPVCAVCPNNEVIVLQPWTGTALNLGSVASYAFHSNPPAPTVSTVSLDHFLPLYPNPPPPLSNFCRCSPSIFHMLTTSSPDVKCFPSGCRPHPPPASMDYSSLRPAPRPCIYSRVL